MVPKDDIAANERKQVLVLYQRVTDYSIIDYVFLCRPNPNMYICV
jgi:hypothetical protein